jgi:hypothetical protein
MISDHALFVPSCFSLFTRYDRCLACDIGEGSSWARWTRMHYKLDVRCQRVLHVHYLVPIQTSAKPFRTHLCFSCTSEWCILWNIIKCRNDVADVQGGKFLCKRVAVCVSERLPLLAFKLLGSWFHSIRLASFFRTCGTVRSRGAGGSAASHGPCQEKNGGAGEWLRIRTSPYKYDQISSVSNLPPLWRIIHI